MFVIFVIYVMPCSQISAFYLMRNSVITWGEKRDKYASNEYVDCPPTTVGNNQKMMHFMQWLCRWDSRMWASLKLCFLLFTHIMLCFVHSWVQHHDCLWDETVEKCVSLSQFVLALNSRFLNWSWSVAIRKSTFAQNTVF